MKQSSKHTLLLCALASLLLASCGDDGKVPAVTDASPNGTQTEAVTSDPYPDDLPDGLDYQGYDFRVLTYDGGNMTHSGGWNAYIDVNETNGEVLNDAAFDRNTIVEERLNVHISCIENGTEAEIREVLYKSVMAGEDAYDMMIAQFVDGYYNARSLQSLYSIKEIPHIDLTKPYYKQSVEETFTIGDKLYFLSGDFVAPLYSSSFIFFNRSLWGQYGLEDPYELVHSGQWTYDKCIEIVKGTYQDIDGSGTRNKDDFFGINAAPITVGYNFVSCGGSCFTMTDDGYELTVTSEHNTAILEKLISAMDNPDIFVNSDGNLAKEIFFGGRSIMYFSCNSIVLLRDASFDTGILPFPKYDEAQENYISVLAGGLTVIPATIADPDRNGAITEALFSASMDTVKEAFYQQYVENKVLTDEGSPEMLRIVIEGGIYDFTRFFDPSGAIRDRAVINGLLERKSTDLASAWAKVESKVRKGYDAFFAEMEG